jgi:hypothetical protein
MTEVIVYIKYRIYSPVAAGNLLVEWDVLSVSIMRLV